MFGPFSLEKGEKYQIMECYLVWVMGFSTSVVLSHFYIVSMFLSVPKINLAPFLQEEALNDNVMRNYMLINFHI